MKMHTFCGSGSPAHAAKEAAQKFNLWQSALNGSSRLISVTAVFASKVDDDGLMWGEYIIQAVAESE